MSQVSTHSTEIRLLTKDLARRLHEIECEVYPEPWSLDLFVQTFEAPMTHHLGVFKGGRCVGYAIYQVFFQEAHLLNIAVSPLYQGRGYARALMEKILREISNRSVFSIFLEVRPGNEPARKLYESMGFRFLMSRPRYYANGEEALVLVKVLEP